MTRHEQTSRAVRSALKQAQTDLETAKRERQTLADKVAATDDEITRLTSTVSQLTELAASLEDQTQVTDAVAAPAATSLAKASRTDAIEQILTDAGEALPSAEITRRLRAHGRDDPRKNVSAALSYLARKDRITFNKEAGTWATA